MKSIFVCNTCYAKFNGKLVFSNNSCQLDDDDEKVRRICYKSSYTCRNSNNNNNNKRFFMMMMLSQLCTKYLADGKIRSRNVNYKHQSRFKK